MIKNPKRKKWLVPGLLLLVALNAFAFYFIKEGIGITEAIKNTKNKEALQALHQKEIFSDIFPSVVFTIDIFSVLFLLFLLVKFLLKTLKKPTSQK